MLVRTTLFCILGFLFSTHLFAKSLPSTEKVEQASEFFMAQVLKGDVESAYSLISAYAGIDLEAFLERGKKVANDISKLEMAAGKPLSVAKLKAQSVGEHFYKITYLLKYETAALVWELNYYQPEQGWKLVDVTFNANINALFE